MRLRALRRFVGRWLALCGEACCVGRSQTALRTTARRSREAGR